MNRRRFLLYFLIVMAVLIMICTAIALLVSIKESVKAEAQVKELTFEEQVENMIQTHKIMMDRLIAAWEHRKEEVYLIAEVIFWENWFTDPEHLAAYYSGAVVMNRVKSPLWPDTVKGVVYQKGQYSTTKYFYTKELPPEVYEMAWDIYRYGTPDVPYNVVFQATFKQGSGDWIEPINGEHFCYGRA